MEKTKLNKFIQKYNLGGNVNSVKWTAGTNQLKTSFVTPDKSLLGTVVADNVKFEDADLGVYQTDQLQKLLNVLDNDVDLSLFHNGSHSYIQNSVGDLYIYNNAENKNIYFRVDDGGTDRFLMTLAAGNFRVGIGESTTDPKSTLHVSSSGVHGILIDTDAALSLIHI